MSSDNIDRSMRNLSSCLRTQLRPLGTAVKVKIPCTGYQFNTASRNYPGIQEQDRNMIFFRSWEFLENIGGYNRPPQLCLPAPQQALLDWLKLL